MIMLRLELKAFVAHADPQWRLALMSRIDFFGRPSGESTFWIELCRARKVVKATKKSNVETFFQAIKGHALEILGCIKRATNKQVLHMNYLLALDHLNSDLIVRTPNPQSLKMNATMSVAVRKASGTFLSPEGLERLIEEEKEILR
jgi:hypothetical protein